MPKLPIKREEKYALGIDPGENGAAVLLGSRRITFRLEGKTPADIWQFFNSYKGLIEFAVIEQIIPRPTMVFDHEIKRVVPRILKSTCQIYGSYIQLCSFLIAAGIPFEDCPPQRWQKPLHIAPREKKEPEKAFKRRLRYKAQTLFPREKIIADTGDAFLIAEYCRQSRLSSQ